MEFADFKITDFPPVKDSLPTSRGGFVYVFCWIADGTEIPFYVGQTDRLSGRMNDYRLKNFSCCPDFCVGEAVEYLKRAKHYHIVVRYRPSIDPPKEEKAIIRDLLLSGTQLLNCLPKYDYRTSKPDEERIVVQRFCDMLARTNGPPFRAVDS